VRVAVLGCGPAGLLAAHGANLLGNVVTIFSHLNKSPMLGAQFMHIEIPGLALDPPQKLMYVLHGSYEGYRAKVYGDQDVEFISPETFAGYHEAWSIRQAYNRLWDTYRQNMLEVTIDHAFLSQILGEFDIVFSTIPAKSLCYNRHNFTGQQVWVDDTWHGPGITGVRDFYGAPNVVICDGTSTNSWYRTSYIYGHSNTEWPKVKTRTAPFRAKTVIKPLATDCNCWPGVIRAGRYGAWMKGILSHQAFEVALEVLR